ncbi:glutathione S-transferase [Achromobacter sp. Marseille-Q4962]|uniref:glutathione S-transferase family protein n=1 Tax=Achromobacter sp. Marseille-Q4962 TaxID=2942202 RepID=UPI002072FABE|nr:glutathione S-transferase [Achromobacter sp. Marseille-Q4962]
MKPYELIGSMGCGSAIVEMALALARVPHTLTDIPYLKPGPQRDRLLRINPLGQVPTMVTPDGEVLTESAAMMLHLHDVAPRAGLAPPSDDPARPRFLNLLIRLVAAVYPTFTYGDDPPQWTGPGPAAEHLRARVHARRADIWQEIERYAGAPHMLGARFSALDLYLAVMTRWRPGPAWFAEYCPALSAVARAAAEKPEVAGVLARHFPPPTE